ncbi:zinc ribbon domain-containing protein [Pseudactinotalea sp. Z1748]|uniref:zinc ribbon domain-containing protein n=1 Tax=Pseudactinotalea sp. Z1748 TaxID=3413027 RepID=UPI003C7DBD77
MSTAPVSDQRALLDLQALDTALAKLAHRRNSHPTLATLAELTARAEDLDRSRAQTQMLVSDTRRELLKAETDVEQVRNRADRDRQRLESGTGSPKDLQALSAELESLGKRQNDLEEVELEVMERLEAAEHELQATTTQLEAIRADITRVEAERDAAFAELDAESEQHKAARDELAAGIDEALLALYERVRAKTGGLGAVALRGSATQGVQVPLSLTEKAAIEAAPPERVLRSEDYDYILVRLDD